MVEHGFSQNSNQNSKSSRTSNKALLILLALLGIIIILIASIVVSNLIINQPNISEKDKLIDVSEALPDWKQGEVPDLMRAAILDTSISEKLRTDPNYDMDQAIAEYEHAYQESTGNLKVYVACYYATFVSGEKQDFNRALEILDIKEYVNEQNEKTYYSVLVKTYKNLNDFYSYDYYKEILDEILKKDAEQENYENDEEFTINVDKE